MALVRVYCGLSSTQPAQPGDPAGAWLTVAVVDDSGRLLDVCDVSDDPVGYAELGAMLAERSGGSAGVAVAADTDEHQITLLLAAAGRPLAIADDDSLDDYAERFADDDSADEVEAPRSERRAIGLARALQAGALAAAVHSAPRELLALKPVLAAHAAVASGRQGAAVALREVLRELYPAALRAYPDPCEPIPLAILDALPEPGLLGSGTANRGRDAAVAAELTAAGVADATRISEAITALRVAIAETPRRTGIGKSLTAAVAQTIQQAVAAVRACDAAVAALVGLLAEKATPVPASRITGLSQPVRGSAHHGAEPSGREAAQQAHGPAGRDAAEQSRPLPRRNRPTPGPGSQSGATVNGLPVRRPRNAPVGQPGTDQQPISASPVPVSTPAAMIQVPAPDRSPSSAYPPVPAPRLAPEVTPPGSRTDWPLHTNGTGGFPQVDPAGMADPDRAANPASYMPAPVPQTVLERPPAPAPAEQRDGRVPPPWQADDMPSEPPVLRLVEPGPELDRDPLGGSFERAAFFDQGRPGADAGSTPPLRLVDGDGQPHRLMDSTEALREHSGTMRSIEALREPSGRMAPVGSDESDGDLLIFAEASAWFTGHLDREDTQLHWDNPADLGWQAAQRASQPVRGDETTAGLPRRVPQANLIPGSPLPPAANRNLRVVRDPAAMAAHTTGYFRGSRRGEEVRGFAVGGRPGRESAVGWEFTRDTWEGEPEDNVEYRSAARR